MSYHRYNLQHFILLIILAILFAHSRAQQYSYNTSASLPYCRPGGNVNDSYLANLRTLLSNLSANVDQNGFYNATVGENPNRAHVIVLCRGDVQLDSCHSCIQQAVIDLVRECPNSRQALLWHEFCMLRYSDESIVGTLDIFPVYSQSNTTNSTRPDAFMSDLTDLLDNISSQASNGGSLRKVGYGTISTVGFQTIFALEQCTPDLSAEDCLSCLTTATQVLPLEFYGTVGARINLPSCNLRYEVYPFYNITRLQEFQPRAMPPAITESGNDDNSGVMPPAVTESGNGDNSATQTIVIAVVSVVASLLIGGFIFFSIRKVNLKQRKENQKNDDVDETSVLEALQYDFGVIRAATCHFSEDSKLGQGGFGAVYKGKLPNGQEIAVKRLSKSSGQGDLEFKNEVKLLAKLQHRNLVRLFGSSLKGPEKLLVYEFVQNASLDRFLFDPTRRSQLDWGTRSKIIVGIARGILYLHEDSRFSIIHRDIKASNILLDGEMNPKIADFGMARLFVPNEAEANTNRIVGTYGYMAPEYATRGQFSVKSDVFSFGVLLLEIITGQKNHFFQREEAREDLISSVWKNWHKEVVSDSVDPVLMVGSSIQIDILKCIHISLLCVQENVAKRPTMASVVSMLNSPSMDLPEPLQPPPYYMYTGHDNQSPLEHELSCRDGNFNNLANNEEAQSGDQISFNELSITEFYGR